MDDKKIRWVLAPDSVFQHDDGAKMIAAHSAPTPGLVLVYEDALWRVDSVVMYVDPRPGQDPALDYYAVRITEIESV